MGNVTLNQVKESITKRFQDNWSLTEFVLEGEDFKGPTDVAWVRLTVRNKVSKQWTLGQIGNRIFQRQGLIIGSIFTPVNQGTQQSDQLVQAFKDLFEAVNFDAVECYDANVKELGVDGLWLQVAVQVDFNYNETK